MNEQIFPCDPLPSAPEVYDYEACERAIAPLRQDIYATAGGYCLPVNIYAPAAKSGNADTAVLCIHGGSWVTALKRRKPWEGDWMRHHAHYFAALGFYGLEITYRSIKAPFVHLTDIVSDVMQAMAYIKNTLAPEFGFKRIAVIGDSAGGHLALCLALAEDESLRPDAVIACNPVSDCVRDPRWHGKLSSASRQRAVSPLHLAKKTATKILLAHGTADTVVPISDSEALHAALKNRGTDVTLLPIEGAKHAFILYGYNPDTQAVTRYMAKAVDFLNSLR